MSLWKTWTGLTDFVFNWASMVLEAREASVFGKEALCDSFSRKNRNIQGWLVDVNLIRLASDNSIRRKTRQLYDREGASPSPPVLG